MAEGAARTLKRQLAGYVAELLETQGPPLAEGGVALGLAPRADGEFVVAVRYRLGVPTARRVVRSVAAQVGPAVDVRRTGRVRAQARRAQPGPRPLVATALALGETGRTRPLRPGVSISHVLVGAGTLGAFVRVDGAVDVLSNYHVLVGSPSSRLGDPTLQPGRGDGGQEPEDRVAALAGFHPLLPGGRGVVDAAVARLDPGVEVDPRFPVGPVTATVAAAGPWRVAKVGRTTGLTCGRITAVELDDVVVGYGDELGELTFDDQVEVEGLGGSSFSRGGDSGALVYRTDGEGEPAAVGLLFAGSETGGENGQGLTYLNPIGPVLAALGAELVGGEVVGEA
jgi:hypothetical protein